MTGAATRGARSVSERGRGPAPRRAAGRRASPGQLGPDGRQAALPQQWRQTKGLWAMTVAEDDGAQAAESIRVLVVDDHEMFRAGLVSLLSTRASIDVVAQASSGRQAVQLVDALHPDVVLMDLRMPDV